MNAEDGDDTDGDGSPGNPYRTIQKGVDQAQDDDTIMVHPGTYTEFVDVGKRLTITSTTGNPNITNVTGPDWTDWVFQVTSDWVNITSFRISGTRGGFMGGIFLDSVSNCNISGNNVTRNAKGIRMDDVTHTSIFGNTIDSNGNEGLYVLRGSHDSFTSNVIQNNSNGLYIFSSTQVAITDNQVSENYYGMDLNSLTAPASVTGNTITRSTARGIEIDKCEGVEVESNTITDNPDYGLYLVASEDCWLGNNTMENDPHDLGFYPFEKEDLYHTIGTTNTVHGAPVYYWVGEENRTVPDDAGFVGLIDCANITVEDLNLDGVTSHGIMLIGSADCTVQDNEINDVRDHAIYLGYGAERNVVSGNVIRNDPNKSNHGIHLFRSSGNEITGNDVRKNWYGIRLEESPGNTIFSNTANENTYGIYLFRNSDDCLVRDNTAGWNEAEGIFLHSSTGVRITENECPSNWKYGISLYQSSQNEITENTLKDNLRYDLYISEYKAETDGHYDNFIVNNTGSGDRPIKYFNTPVTLENEELSQLILCGADGSTVRNVTIMGSDIRKNNGLMVLGTDDAVFTNVDASDCWYGLYLGWSNGNRFEDCAFSSCDEDGIRLYDGSEGNIFEGCTANSNDVAGIFISGGRENTVANGTFDSNGRDGILIFFSGENVITGNTIRDNTNDGIRTGAADDNLVYNNYLNNSKNAVDAGSNDWHIDPVRGKNIMGGSYLGGNFWSDYAGNDTDGDGLGDTDTPHTSGGAIQNGGDDHPLLPPHLVLDVEKTVDRNEVRPGDTINVTITVTNIWSDAVTNITITEFYDPDTRFVSADPSPTSGNDTWSIGTLQANESFEITILLEVADGLPDQIVIRNEVEVSCDQGFPVSDEAVVTVIAPVLAMYVSDVPDPVDAGGWFNLSVVVENQGHAGATDIRVTAQYDNGTGFVSSDPAPDEGITAWTVARLDPWEFVRIRLNLSVSAGITEDRDVITEFRATCHEGVAAMETELTSVLADQGERTVAITIDSVTGDVVPEGALNVSGTITIEPDGDVETLTVTIDGNGTAGDPAGIDPDGTYHVTVTLPAGLLPGNHTITVNVTLVSGESSEASRQITYSGGPGPVTHAITISIDPIEGGIAPGDGITISGSVTVEPASPIRRIAVLLDGSGIDNATLADGNFSLVMTVPPTTLPGDHEIRVTVELMSGESNTAAVTLTVIEQGSGDEDDGGAGVGIVIVILLLAIGAAVAVLFRMGVLPPGTEGGKEKL